MSHSVNWEGFKLTHSRVDIDSRERPKEDRVPSLVIEVLLTLQRLQIMGTITFKTKRYNEEVGIRTLEWSLYDRQSYNKTLRIPKRMRTFTFKTSLRQWLCGYCDYLNIACIVCWTRTNTSGKLTWAVSLVYYKYASNL